MFRHSDDFSWRCSGPTLTCLSCTGGLRAGVSGGRTEGESPPSNCWPQFFLCSPGYHLLSGMQTHVAASFNFFCPPVSPSPSLPGCSQSIHPPFCPDIEDCSDPGAGPCMLPVTASAIQPHAWCLFFQLIFSVSLLFVSLDPSCSEEKL